MTAVAEEARALVAPMTRAQKFQWHLERGLTDGLRRLPDRYDSSSVLRLVESLQRQYEILRTSIDIVDGDLCQRVHESGEPVVTVDVTPQADVGVAAATLAEEFVGSTIRHVGQILVKFYLLRQGAARWLAIADCTAVDRAFYEMLDARITQMLGETRESATGGGDAPKGLQATRLALREDSPRGRAERQEAREYLRQHYSAAPPALHPRYGAGESLSGRYYRCSLTVARADEIFAHIIETSGRLPSAVILGTFAYLMCWRADALSCVVNVSMENRYNTELRTALCATSLRVPVSLPMPGEILGDAVFAAQSALSAGYPTAGRYDPFDLIEERAAAEARRGLCLTPDLAFNFNPPPQGWTALLGSALTGGALDDVPHSNVGVKSTNETSYEYGASLSVRWRDAHAVRLSVHGDSRALSVDECTAVLRGIETGLRKFAREPGSVSMADIVESAGLTKTQRHAREVRVDGIWYDRAAIERCLLEIDGVKHVEFFFAPHQSGGPTVRAVVSDDAAIRPPDLRSALLDHVRVSTLTAIPVCYQVTKG
jgi:hypothetical protein